MASVEEPRIGRGTGYFVAGVILLFIGIFAALAASGGSSEAAPFAEIALTLAAGLIVVGFWVRLFGLLELRLIDMETALKRAAPGQRIEPS
jgi:hypothetical protein